MYMNVAEGGTAVTLSIMGFIWSIKSDTGSANFSQARPGMYLETGMVVCRAWFIKWRKTSPEPRFFIKR